MIASGSWDKSVRLWNSTTDAEIKTMQEHLDKINALCFSPDGKLLASGSDDKSVIVWSVGTGKIFKDLKKHTDVVSSVCFSPNGKYVASGSWDKTIVIWDIATGLPYKTLTGHKSGVLSVSFSKDSKYLASGGDDNSVKLWDVNTGNLLKSFDQHHGAVYSVVFSPNDFLLVSGSDDKTIKIWDIVSGQLTKTFIASEKAITYLTFSRDAALLASVSDDNTIKIWDMSDYKYEKCIKAKLALYSDMCKPKDEFETTEQYNARIEQYKKIKSGLKQECINDEIKGVQSSILGTYKYVYLKIASLSNYNADAQQYQVTVNNNSYTLSMPVDEARSFKDSWQTAKVKGIERKNLDGTEVINMQVIHPSNSKTYPIGKQVSADDDKMLKDFLDKNK
jgi:WD40 repeat protein